MEVKSNWSVLLLRAHLRNSCVSLGSWFLPDSRMFIIYVIVVSTFVLLPSPGSQAGGDLVGFSARPLTCYIF